jgi:hypothetical protein
MRIDPRGKGFLLGLAAILLIAGVLLIALPLVVHALSASAGAQAQPLVAMNDTAVQSTVATPQVTAPPEEPSAVDQTIPADPPTALTPNEAPAALTPAPPALAEPTLDAYRGLGSWIDIYDDRAWNNPSAAVADMAKHGVRTLYIETSNSRSSFVLKDSAALATFIRESHSRGMRVVAWYLPDMTNLSTDYNRIAQAIQFHTSDGQKFDSFALDIESDVVKPESTRNKALASLTSKIRGLVGDSYVLGAITPSPTGLAKKGGYWDSFPYEMVAQKYDVFVPMGYYTYHGHGASLAYSDTLSNVRILRAQKGCSKTPIHLIGGIAQNSSTAEVRSFVRAVVESHCFGASLYSWPGTTSSDWEKLAAIKP